MILVSLAVSLVLHAAFAVATWHLDLYPQPDTALAQIAPDEILVELIPATLEGAPEVDQQPDTYTSIPKRLASDTPPEQADFLSMHEARAADLLAGGDDLRPAAPEEGDFEQVQIKREEFGGTGAVVFSPGPLREERAEQSGSQAGPREIGEQRSSSQDLSGSGRWALPQTQLKSGEEGASDTEGTEEGADRQEENLWGGQTPSILKTGQPGDIGDQGFDFNQRAIGDLGSGVSIVDNFSLNTYAWEWAPWMERFGNQLHRNWIVPYAYRLGVIHGQTVVRLVVARDGRPSSMEILETLGHQSLHDASLGALRSFQPYSPLPAHFPEENLVIILSLNYPAWRR